MIEMFPSCTVTPIIDSDDIDIDILVAGSNMDLDPPALDHGGLAPGTAAGSILVDESAADGESEHGGEMADNPDNNSLKVFTLFPELPIELRLKVWDLAFPPRVVNITFHNNRPYSFNSSPPKLLQIHQETREYALRTYKPYLGDLSQETQQNKTWIDFARDVILPRDDYIAHTLVDELTGALPDNFLGPESSSNYETIQNLAISAENLRHCHQREGAVQSMADSLCAHCPLLKNLYIVYEHDLNPYSTGRIRFFPMERTCLPSCNDKGCIRLALITAKCQQDVDKMRASKQVLARGVKVHFVGAWRGGSRAEFGHAIDGYEDESGDEYHNSEDEPEDGWASDGSMVTPDEARGRIVYNLYLEYDEADDEASFSDHDGWQHPECVSEQECMELRYDEKAYRSLIPASSGSETPSPRYEDVQGQALTLIMRDPNDYYAWRKQDGRKCYPIFHPDGSYKAF